MEVTLYTKNNCGMCNNTKRYLKMVGAAFTEKNVEVDEKFMDEARMTGFTSMPIVRVGEEIFSGHRPDKLEEIFGAL